MADVPGVRPAAAGAACPVRALRVDGDRWTGDGVCVVRHRGRLHAFEEECPHGAVSLSDATVAGGAVVCPAHGARFRLADGKVLSGPARRPLACFDVVETAEGIAMRPRSEAAARRRPLRRWLERLRVAALPWRRRTPAGAPLWCRPSAAVPARRRESRV